MLAAVSIIEAAEKRKKLAPSHAFPRRTRA
jgi:hypothetical protein